MNRMLLDCSHTYTGPREGKGIAAASIRNYNMRARYKDPNGTGVVEIDDNATTVGTLITCCKTIYTT